MIWISEACYQTVRIVLLISLVIVQLSLWPSAAFADNNKFGIHITNEADLNDAAKLVNSSGGEWGYVTLVIREDERDIARWQSVFDSMRELKLIPLVRLATKTEGTNWKKPIPSDADSWVDFLSSLNWVVKNRYVILFNEPNHAGEWGGIINPREYAQVASVFQKRLKETSADYFILPAGLDSSAPNSSKTMAADKYWSLMASEVPKIFTIFDGWNSHSYPNPAFSSLPSQSGRGSVRSFSWEVSFLSRYGLRQDTPVFITETGWVHNENAKSKVLGFNSETVGKFFQDAWANAWSDKRIKAVTPFILNYPGDPFTNFSWKNPVSNEYYPQFAAVQAIPKVKGEPEQEHKSTLIEHSLPNKTVTSSSYVSIIKFQNFGQSIWSEEAGFSLDFKINGEKANLENFSIGYTKPRETAEVKINFRSPSKPGVIQVSVQMLYKNQKFGDLLTHSIEVLEPPKLKIYVSSLFGSANGQDIKLLVYKNNEPVKEITNLSFEKGSGEVELRDISPEEQYRFVLIKPYHLPVQTWAFVAVPETSITFPLVLPLDRNNDGQLTQEDLFSLF